jgi:opacity protein-like surface antigen
MVVTKLKLTAAVSMLMGASAVQAQLYWRADVGVSSTIGLGIHDKNFATDRAICGNDACTAAGMVDRRATSMVLSGGVGWRLNRNFRADATIVDRVSYSVKQTMPDSTDVTAKVRSWNLMANGYYDVPLPFGTPYFGAGLGWASNKVNNVNFSNSGVTVRVPGGTKSGVALALMAGVGVPITSTITLDIGYRYTDLGKLETSRAPNYSGAIGRLRTHEFVLGYRF